VPTSERVAKKQLSKLKVAGSNPAGLANNQALRAVSAGLFLVAHVGNVPITFQWFTAGGGNFVQNSCSKKAAAGAAILSPGCGPQGRRFSALAKALVDGALLPEGHRPAFDPLGYTFGLPDYNHARPSAAGEGG
jgi:hypothetical protein